MTVFTKNREQVLTADVAARFLARLIATGLYNVAAFRAKDVELCGLLMVRNLP